MNQATKSNKNIKKNRVEKKSQPQKRPSSSTQLHLNPSTRSVTVDELFHLRLGTLRLRQRWLDRDVSPSLTAAIAVFIGVVGFLCGVLVSSFWSWSWCWIWMQMVWDAVFIDTIVTMVPSWMTVLVTTMTTTLMDMGSTILGTATTSWSCVNTLLHLGLTTSAASFERVGVNIIGVGFMG